MPKFSIDQSVNAFQKDRDYAHSTFAEHQFANGAMREIKFPVMCNVDPVTEDLLDPPQRYFIVEVRLHGGKDYWYLVPAESDGSEPNLKTLKDTMNAYNANPVDGGRDCLDYIDEEQTEEMYLDEVVERYVNRIIN